MPRKLVSFDWAITRILRSSEGHTWDAAN